MYNFDLFQAKPSLCINNVCFSLNHWSVGSATCMDLGISSAGWFMCGVGEFCWVVNTRGCDVTMIACTTSYFVLSYCGLRERASTRKFLPPGIYFNWELKCLKYKAYLTCFGDNRGGVWSASKFLWSVQTSKGVPPPSNKCCYINRAHWTANASFSDMGQLRSFPVNFLDV